MHEVFEGKTFEGHTMLWADNMDHLNEQGYQFIVGARLGNLSKGFIEQIHTQTPRKDDATVRFKHTMKKDKREQDKQINRALLLIDQKEPGRRAKFVKKADAADSYQLNVELKAKAEKLLGVKGYVTNIPQKDLGNQEVIDYYHELWHVEQAFRITQSDLQARPIYHRTEVTIKSHVLICFMALMMSKYLEIKTQVSIKQIRNQLWKIHEAHLRDERTGQTHVLTMNDRELANQALIDLLKHYLPH